jgi:methyl-accepting chemotaxis protein
VVVGLAAAAPGLALLLEAPPLWIGLAPLVLGGGGLALLLRSLRSSVQRTSEIETSLSDARQAARSAWRHTERLSEKLASVGERLGQALDEVSHGGEEQEEAVEETASLLANINTSIASIQREVESLSGAAEEVSSSILQMGSSIDEVARSTGGLAESVDASSASIHEMSASIRQVAESADAVQSMAEQTAASMVQMDRAIQEVGGHVSQASVRTQQVADEADEGAGQVQATIEGIQQIRSLTAEAKAVLARLAQRIGAIGEIVSVISGINDETNLLSLNAAIIAAQAGEQGKAFSVVANHVKTLAQRTGSSTQEIAGLIHAVQQESSNALEAMDAGARAVEAGVERSHRAGEALVHIRASAQEASERVAEISRAAGEQARNSRHVAEAAQRTSAMVQQIGSAVSQQSAASETLLRNAEGALDRCRQVHRSVEEQRETGRFIVSSTNAIREMIEAIRGSLATHAQASGSVSSAAERILSVAHKSLERIADARSALRSAQADESAETTPD